MKIKNKRILKNGAIAGYVYYKNEKKWKWRIVGNNKKKGGSYNLEINSLIYDRFTNKYYAKMSLHLPNDKKINYFLYRSSSGFMWHYGEYIVKEHDGKIILRKSEKNYSATGIVDFKLQDNLNKKILEDDYETGFNIDNDLIDWKEESNKNELAKISEIIYNKNPYDEIIPEIFKPIAELCKCPVGDIRNLKPNIYFAKNWENEFLKNFSNEFLIEKFMELHSFYKNLFNNIGGFNVNDHYIFISKIIYLYLLDKFEIKFVEEVMKVTFEPIKHISFKKLLKFNLKSKIDDDIYELFIIEYTNLRDNKTYHLPNLIQQNTLAINSNIQNVLREMKIQINNYNAGILTCKPLEYNKQTVWLKDISEVNQKNSHIIYFQEKEINDIFFSYYNIGKFFSDIVPGVTIDEEIDLNNRESLYNLSIKLQKEKERKKKNNLERQRLKNEERRKRNNLEKQRIKNEERRKRNNLVRQRRERNQILKLKKDFYRNNQLRIPRNITREKNKFSGLIKEIKRINKNLEKFVLNDEEFEDFIISNEHFYYWVKKVGLRREYVIHIPVNPNHQAQLNKYKNIVNQQCYLKYNKIGERKEMLEKYIKKGEPLEFITQYFEHPLLIDIGIDNSEFKLKYALAKCFNRESKSLPNIKLINNNACEYLKNYNGGTKIYKPKKSYLQYITVDNKIINAGQRGSQEEIPVQFVLPD